MTHEDRCQLVGQSLQHAVEMNTLLIIHMGTSDVCLTAWKRGSGAHVTLRAKDLLGVLSSLLGRKPPDCSPPRCRRCGCTAARRGTPWCLRCIEEYRAGDPGE